jgi:hypothetical protein
MLRPVTCHVHYLLVIATLRACSCNRACQTQAGSLLRQQRCTLLHTPRMGCCFRPSSAARARWRDRDAQSTAAHAAGMHQVLYFVHQVVHFVYSTSCCSRHHVLVWFPAADNNSAARVRWQDRGAQSTAGHAAGASRVGFRVLRHAIAATSSAAQARLCSRDAQSTAEHAAGMLPTQLRSCVVCCVRACCSRAKGSAASATLLQPCL